MKINRNAWLLTTLISAAMLCLTACNPANDAGMEVLPADGVITGQYADTFSIEMRTNLLDSVLTHNLSRCMVGNYADQQFGKIYAETYIQTRITGSNLQFGPDPSRLTLDSLVLTLDLTGFYGRYNEAIPLEIFEITQSFPADSTLNSTSRLAADTTFDLADNFVIDFSTQPGFFDFINIRLNDSLGKKLLFANPADLASNPAFTNFFKGLLIRSKDVSQLSAREPGGVFYFDPRSNVTKLIIHYKDSTAVKQHSFEISANSERFHRIYRTEMQNRLLDQAIRESGDPNAPYAAVEAGAFVTMYVGIPSIKSLDPAVVNRADLVLSVDGSFLGSLERFEPPKEIFLFVSDSTKKNPYNPSLQNSSAAYNPASKTYTIPMTNTLQQILAGRLPSYGFIIIPGENGVSLNRAVIGGPGHPSLKPKLKVYYTTLPGKNG